MSLLNVKIGDKAPEIFNAVVEIPKDSQNKYEIDKQTGMVSLDRVLYSPMHYPADYGFIPETKAEDGDPAASEQDNKILGVQADNPRFDSIKDISDIEKFHTHHLKEIAHFFQTYKELQGKKVEILGWENAESAKKEIAKARKMYK